MFESPAYAATGATAGGAGMGLLSILPWVAVLLIFYLLMIRPQQQRHELELEVAQGVSVRVVKSMLSDIRPHGAKAAND